MPGSEAKSMPPFHSPDYYGDRQRQRQDELVRLYEEKNKIENEVREGPGSATPEQRQRLEAIDAESNKLAKQGERDGKEQNSGLTGEALDRLDELQRESQSRALGPAEAKELEALKRAVDNAPETAPPAQADPGVPQIGVTDNGRDLVTPENDLGAVLGGNLGGAQLGDLGGGIPTPAYPFSNEDLGLLGRYVGGDGEQGMEGFDPVDSSAKSGSGSSGSGQTGDSGNDAGDGAGDAGGGMSGGGMEARAMSDGPDTPGAIRRIGGLAGLGRGHLSLNEAVRHRLGNVINPTGDTPIATGSGPAHTPAHAGGHIVGDPGPGDAGVRAPTPEERDRFRRPGSDPRFTDPPDDDTRT
jgi:hypothetical protein